MVNKISRKQAKILIDAYEINKVLENEEEVNCLKDANPKLLDACRALSEMGKTESEEVKTIIKMGNKLGKVRDLILEYGTIDGGHHKMWVLDQALRILCGDNYDQILKKWEGDEYKWDIGIAP